MDRKKITYESSGVNIDRASETLSGLREVISSTFSKNVISDLSSFAGLYRLDSSTYREPVLVSSTDGVGTKLILAGQMNDYSGVGQDLVAMSINDLLCCGAKPLFFLDYIACGRIDKKVISTVVGSVAKACKTCETALIGGETAEMPDMYAVNEIDLAGFAVGIAEKSRLITPSRVKRDDILVGITSSGIHSNGFSLVRKIIREKGLDLFSKLKWTGGKKLGEVLLTPTKLYYGIINRIINKEKIDIHGIANITGGGFYDNINRIIPSSMDACIYGSRWSVPPVFTALQELGNIDSKEMYRVFNMGIGMVVIIPEKEFSKVQEAAKGTGENVLAIGEVKDGNGKVIVKTG
ncbi:MAG: phosphoribosylformylglycinamidine cyclo-ligase [Actinobacteria bacterium]|nr:phosphoribosylformylglycinamidine cyclo-ligase [Actinomycetota bacterium]